MALSAFRRDVTHRRWLPAVLAVALVGGQGAVAAHFALVKHAYCGEHGELIHPDAAQHVSGPAHASKTPGLYAAGEDELEHGHDHCVLSGVRRHAAPVRHAGAVLPIDGGHVELAHVIAWAPSSATRLRIAPKQSPPA
jgi:hypothetical protein